MQCLAFRGMSCGRGASGFTVVAPAVNSSASMPASAKAPIPLHVRQRKSRRDRIRGTREEISCSLSVTITSLLIDVEELVAVQQHPAQPQQGLCRGAGGT